MSSASLAHLPVFDAISAATVTKACVGDVGPNLTFILPPVAMVASTSMVSPFDKYRIFHSPCPSHSLLGTAEKVNSIWLDQVAPPDGRPKNGLIR